MSVVAESFQTYLRRRRRLLARRLKRQQGWGVVLALLALYLVSWDALSEGGSLLHLGRGQPLWLVVIPLLGEDSTAWALGWSGCCASAALPSFWPR